MKITADDYRAILNRRIAKAEDEATALLDHLNGLRGAPHKADRAGRVSIIWTRLDALVKDVLQAAPAYRAALDAKAEEPAPPTGCAATTDS